MRRLSPGLLVALFSILLVAGGVADRAMVQRARDEREAAEAKASENSQASNQQSSIHPAMDDARPPWARAHAAWPIIWF